MLRPQIIYSFGRYILSMLTDSLITSWSLISAGGEKTVLEAHTLVLQRESWFSADGMSPLRFEPRPLAPKFDWVELGNERAERETWAEKYQGGRTGEPRDGVLMERIDKTTDCRGRQNGRKSSCDTRKFFPIYFCENVNNRHETQATWFICRHCTQLYSKIYSDKAWNVSRKLSVNGTVSLSI